SLRSPRRPARRPPRREPVLARAAERRRSRARRQLRRRPRQRAARRRRLRVRRRPRRRRPRLRRSHRAHRRRGLADVRRDVTLGQMVIAAVALLLAAAPAARELSIAAPGLQVSGLDVSLAAPLTDQLGKPLTPIRVITPRDIAALLGLERQKEL